MLLHLLAALSVAPFLAAAQATVETTVGTVKGRLAPWPASSNVSEYLGIPYAEPPIGKLRFAAPQPFKGKGPIAGTDFGAGCIQGLDPNSANTEGTDFGVLGYGEGMGGVKGRNYSEDCLTLNIWTKPEGGEKSKAVLVWIYGGAFGAGDTAAPFYNGARFAAEQDVIVASINYRLNVFGFPAAPGLQDVNLGLLDQRLAIEWLRDNIAKFGGDPKRMTLFGESAGGASVDYYTYAWTKDPIINSFIAQSGVTGAIPVTPANNPNWWTLTEKAGCGGKPNGLRTVDCMRDLPALDIQKALTSAAGPMALTFFGPTVDNKVVFNDYAVRRKAGNFIKRPFIAGNTDHEAGLLTGLGLGTLRGVKKNGGIPGAYAEELIKYVNSYRYSNGTFGSILSSLMPLIDSSIGCASSSAVSARRAQGIPAWRYLWMGTWPNQAIYPDIGAYHSIDCPIVFGTVERNDKQGKNTPEEEKFVKNVMTAWATFAKDSEKGLVGLGWPLYDNKGTTLVRLGYQNQSTPSFGSVPEYDRLCPLIGL
ncbi:alpha/beta-hydrolase [Microthyrium microscopicum]|uniref:Carboxylic ester hydrolase n=1 Tax=Microthyrium microscopicum TaxID=703497 RepID=A0A6A6UET8_9PEZI|nr:alpha/beta-hydrolase [Microthyrium microscopicum]